MAIVIQKSGVVNHNQKASSQASRTKFTAGKPTSLPLDENWPKDFEILTGIPVVDALITNNKFIQSVQADCKVGILANTTVKAPITGTPIVTEANLGGIVSDVDSTTTVTPTTTQRNNGAQETKGGYNGFLVNTNATPTFSPVAGAYVGSRSVTIACATFGSIIKYTIDGSTPSPTHGTIYTVPVVVAVSKTVKAIAYQASYFENSAVASATYTIS